MVDVNIVEDSDVLDIPSCADAKYNRPKLATQGPTCFMQLP